MHAVAASSQRIALGYLRELQVPDKDVAKLRDAIHADNQLALDGFDRVELGKIQGTAKRLGIALPEGAIAKLFAPSQAPTLKLATAPGDFPTAKVSAGEARELAARPRDARVGAAELGSLAAPIAAALASSTDAALKAIDPKAGLPATQLAELLTERRGLFRQHLTAEQIEAGLRVAYSAIAPRHVEKDAMIELHSKHQLLAEAKTAAGEAVRVYQKTAVEHLFLRRAKDNQTFELHGFETDRVVVTVPPKGSVVIMDSAGNQRGAGMKPENMKIDGANVSGVEISRSLVQPPDAKMFVETPAFTVKVLDANKNVVHEQRIQFGKDPGQRSKELLRGTFRYGERPEGSSDRELAYAVPSAKTNPAPLGERPRFDVAGAAGCDQLLVSRDGKTFAVNRLAQLMHPSRSTPQAFRAGGLTWELRPQSASTSSLDHPDYDPYAGARLQASDGRTATFDRSLTSSRQARWTSAGMQIWDADKPQQVTTFDPLTSAIKR